MLEHFKGDEEFVSKILDYKDQALYSQRMILTPFLDPHQQSIVQSVIGHELKVEAEGGFDGAENKRVLIAPDFYEFEPEDFKVTIFQVDYNDTFGKLKHSDVLGALMHLGIKRQCIGDINEAPLSFACTKENSDYIRMNLTRIKRSSIHLIESKERISIHQDTYTKTIIVSSLRLDKMVAGLFGISRNKAVEAIHGQYVKLNYKVIEDISKICDNNSIISLRHHGRVKIFITDKRTKQDNYVIEGQYYR